MRFRRRRRFGRRRGATGRRRRFRSHRVRAMRIGYRF